MLKWFAALVVAVPAGLVLIVYLEALPDHDRSGEYVALGSSFAAGPGLGPRQPGSPHACSRTLGNYARLLADADALHLVDVSCGGATSRHLLGGGPFFQHAQVEAVGADAKLVTVTVGGNDVDYIGDLGLLAWSHRQDPLGWLVRTSWSGPRPAAERPFADLIASLSAVVEEVRARAPAARVVLMSYPAVLPAEGTCDAVGISESDATLMRRVALQLAEATREAGRRTGTSVLDMASKSVGHDACSQEPWVNGSRPTQGYMFHPTATGMRAAMLELQQVLARTP